MRAPGLVDDADAWLEHETEGRYGGPRAAP